MTRRNVHPQTGRPWQSRVAVLLAASGLFTAQLAFAQAARISGELKKWHLVTLSFAGPDTAETATPNPFTDYRLDVTFEHPPSGASYVVPGFYAADGAAAHSGAGAGGTWQVRFRPDRLGPWRYRASFRQGENVATANSPAAGKAVSFDGTAGAFDVAASDKCGRDFRARGRLRYVNEHYLQCEETKQWFVKAGVDEPENFLAHEDLDNTPAGKFGIHTYKNHRNDWRPGDPTWKSEKGKSIIGAINYLASTGVNSLYALTYNTDGGDGGDVFPWISPEERTRYDVSKLDQWNIVFCHLNDQGLLCHLLTQEVENCKKLGGLGDLRKLYYRELVARFGHLLALCWNLGEEDTNTSADQQAFAGHLKTIDPWDSPIVIHPLDSMLKIEQTFAPLLGSPGFDGISCQYHSLTGVHPFVLDWRYRSARAGRPWVVCNDEHFHLKSHSDNEKVRPVGLWANIMAGGGGMEFICAELLKIDDFRDLDATWKWVGIAAEFFREHPLPLAEMTPKDGYIVTEGKYSHCLARGGADLFLIYVAKGDDVALYRPDKKGGYHVRWLDPKNGGPLREGTLDARGTLPVPTKDQDWVAIVRKETK